MKLTDEEVRVLRRALIDSSLKAAAQLEKMPAERLAALLKKLRG